MYGIFFKSSYFPERGKNLNLTTFLNYFQIYKSTKKIEFNFMLTFQHFPEAYLKKVHQNKLKSSLCIFKSLHIRLV